MTYTELFAKAIKNLKMAKSGTEVVGLCPFHDDTSPSWSGNRESGLYHCFACGEAGNAKQFAKKLGLDFEDGSELKKKANPWTDYRIVKAYDYKDETGKLIYQVVRFDPKDFRMRSPDGRGGWIDNASVPYRILYNLPQLVDSEVIFVVEGEKDADTLIGHGRVATTLTNGARGKLTVEMVKVFSGKHIVIIPDNDKDGIDLGQRFLEVSSPIAATVKIVNLPHLPLKEDVTWWLNNGHTVDELDKLVQSAKIQGGIQQWEPVFHRFSNVEEKKTPFLWYPYIPIGRLTILEGDPGQGKSWFSLAVATCVSIGQWMEVMEGENNWSEPSGVIYLTCEDDPEDTIKKRLRILQANQENVYYLEGKAKGKEKSLGVTLGDIFIIGRTIDKTRSKLVIIDPIQAYLPGGTDMNKAEQIRPLLNKLQQLATEKQCAMLLVRHLSKGNKDNALYKGMGSIDFTAAARSVLMCGERKEISTVGGVDFKRRFAVAQVKNNISPRGPAIEFELTQDQFLWIGTSDVSPEQIVASSTVNIQALGEMKDFLRNIIGEDGMAYDEVQKQVRKAGLKIELLDQAKTAMGITMKQVFNQWRWLLKSTTVP